MTKKVLIPLGIVIVFIAAIGFLFRGKSALGPLKTPAPKAPSVSINGKEVTVELAKTATEKQAGLSNRKSLDSGGGMLFIYGDESSTPFFWMKGMLIPLDIIWIKDGKIIRIDKNVEQPAPDTPDTALKTYSAGSPVNYVLEVNAGFTDSNSIKVGDSVTVSGI